MPFQNNSGSSPVLRAVSPPLVVLAEADDVDDDDDDVVPRAREMAAKPPAAHHFCSCLASSQSSSDRAMAHAGRTSASRGKPHLRSIHSDACTHVVVESMLSRGMPIWLTLF